MRTLLAALILAAVSSTAQAAVYLSAGYRQSATNAGFTVVSSKGVSGGISVDLGSYIRLGYTYEDSIQKLSGYEDPTSNTTPIDTATGYKRTRPIGSDIHTIAHSIDLQVVLYPGTTITPYLIGGVAYKDTKTITVDPGTGELLYSHPKPTPEPQGGIGLQIQLNAACSFTLQYIVSQGMVFTPIPGADPLAPQVKKTTDGSGSVGLKYKI